MEHFSQVFVLILSTWKFGFIIFLSPIQRIISFLSAIILFLLSASSSYFLFLNVSQRLSFVLLGMKQCPIVVSRQFHIYLLFLGLFDYVSNDISNYVQNF